MKRDTIPTPPVVSPSDLAPDEISVKGKVIKIHNSSDSEKSWFKLKVVQFLGMGSSAPVVTSGDTLKVQALQLPEGIKKDSIYEMNLMHRQVLARFRDSVALWRYVKSKW